MPATLLVRVHVPKDVLLRRAELLADRVPGVPGNLRLGIGKHLAILHVEPLDIRQHSRAIGVELRHDRHLLVRVNRQPGAVERLVALAPGVEVAAVGVARAAVAVGRVGPAAAVTRAGVRRVVGAGVGSVGRRLAVGLPDVHLGAAGAHVANARVGVALRGVPALDVGLRWLDGFGGVRGGGLTRPAMNFMSRGHWLSQ